MPEFPDHAQLANLALIEELYQKYLADPASVDPSWRHFFEGIDFAAYLYKRGGEKGVDRSAVRIAVLVQAYRKYGHLKARFNPLDPSEKKPPELELEKLGFFAAEMGEMFPTMGFCGKEEAPLKEIIEALEAVYCSRIGFEFKECSPKIIEWIQREIEPKLHVEPSIEEKHLILEYLNKAEVMETFLHKRYVGQTRFSLEGGETAIPLIAEMINVGAADGVEEYLIAMAHRGRLNVLANILNKPLSVLLEEFEDDTTLSFAGNDDVKYHMGFAGEFKTRSGNKVAVSMAANPSHLESVDPVAIGQAKARQKQKKVCPILIHGDASIAGQGVVYETLQLMNLPDYTVGGTVHLVINNQIGYTTLPEESRSTRYCTDIAKTFGCPVFHINAEDPESCHLAAKLAAQIRQRFQTDVFLDLYCYRKYGHNEGDEPSYTQPLQYKLIRSKKSIRQLYLDQLLSAGHLEQKMAEALETQFKDAMNKALAEAQAKTEKKGPAPVKSQEKAVTAVDAKILKEVIETFCALPSGFHLHPKLQKWLQDRLASLSGAIDWATGECLAFGSLLKQNVSIRLAGQDSQRGTFSQRHVIWIDSETGKSFCPLCRISGGSFSAVNSPLTEYAGMGFEYGYSLAAASTLVLWEAQYADFNNGAQIIIDQYIASAEQKWNTPSSLTLLLPHAYEGAGPEHSSSRLERFLQLCANDNMRISYPSTPAQYFHLLRRQALLKEKKPLVVLTPKGLLRSPLATSKLADFTQGSFQEILDDPNPPAACKRLILCSGKIYFELAERRKRNDVAIVRVEQLYPLQLDLLKKIIGKYGNFSECCWVQEEPENMGAWRFLGPYLQAVLPKGAQLLYKGRPENATTATGSHKKHKQEQEALLNEAFS